MLCDKYMNRVEIKQVSCCINLVTELKLNSLHQTFKGNFMKTDTVRGIGNIGNYYGGLVIKSEGGNFYWGITCEGDTDWEVIPESLYNSLIEFEDHLAIKAVNK